MLRKTRNFLAMALALTMLFTGVPVYAITVAPGDNLCEHHKGHDETCGYLENNVKSNCTFKCEVCARLKTDEPPVKDSGVQTKSNSIIPLGATGLTGITVENEFGGPPPMASRCAHPAGKLTATPVVESGDTSSVTYAWYYTGADNITDGASNTYSVANPNSGTSLNVEDAFYTAKTEDFGKYLYCIVTLNDNSIASSAFKVVSAPALVGDLVIDYATNTISAPMTKDGESPLMSPDGYGGNMAIDGELRVESGNETIEAKKPTYSNGLLSATFNTSFSNLDSFGISFFHPNYFGLFRESGGKVPTDIILPGEPSVIITLSGGNGNGQIALTDDYVQSVITRVAAANSGKKIVLVIRAEDNAVNLSADVLGAVASGDALYADIDSAKLAINKELLTELDNKEGAVVISAESANVPNNTNNEAKTAIGDRPVVDLSITANSTPVTEFAGDGKVTVSIPYTLAPGEDADNLVIYYIKDDGTTEAITDVTYAGGLVTFTTGHFSAFAVGYVGATSPSEWIPLSFTADYNNQNFGVGFEAHNPSNDNCKPLQQTLAVKTDGLTVTGYQWYITADNGVEMKAIPQNNGDALTTWGPIFESGSPKKATAISSATSASLNTSALKDHSEFKGKKDVRYLFCEVTLQGGAKRYTPIRSIVPDTWRDDGHIDYPYQPIPSLSGARYQGFNSDSKVPAFVGETLTAEPANIAGVNTSNPTYQWYRVAAKDIETRLCGSLEDNTNNQFAKSNAAVTAINGATDADYKPGMAVAGKYIFCRVTVDGKAFDCPVRVVSFMTAPNIKKNSDGTFAVAVNPATKTITMTLEDVTDNDPFNFDADECGGWALENGGIIGVSYDIGQTSYTIAGGGALSYNANTNTITSTFSLWPPQGVSFSFMLYAPPYLLHPDATIHVNAAGVQISPPSSGVKITNKVVVMPAAPNDAAVESALTLLSGAGEDVTELGMLLKGNNATLSVASITALSETNAPNAPNAKVALTVEAPAASMKLDKAVIVAMTPSAGNVVVSADSASVPSNVNSTVKGQIGNRPVVDLTISSNNNPVTTFSSGSATVTIPYTLSASENAANIVVYYIKNDGTTEKITNTSYSNGFVTFTTNHFSKFAVGYQPSNQGGGSTGEESTVIVTTPSPEKPKLPVNAETKIEVKTDSSGKATATVPEKSVASAIKAAQDAMKKAGTKANGLTVTVSLTTDKAAASIAAILHQNTVAELVKAGVAELRIESKTVNITLDLATLGQIQAVGGGNVTVSANAVKPSTLSKEAQDTIGGRPVFDLSIQSGGKAVTNFSGGSASVAVPYALAANEKSGNLYGIYVDKNGKVNRLTNSSYDANAKLLRFATDHFSTFAIGYKQDAPVFKDTVSHWAKNDIDFVVTRGLLNGTGATTFSPDTGITRGMFVTALGRLAGIDSTKYANTKFTDVAATAYYAPFAAWAVEKGITSGTTFSPDKVITRQELAVFMQNYAKATGYTVPKTREALGYVDAASIKTSAKDAVKAMQMAGVMNGKNGNKFDPIGIATRAEVSAVLRRYVNLVIDQATAQGLDINDSGSAIMYENGKRIKSKSRTADGAVYKFNINGEAALPPAKKAKASR